MLEARALTKRYTTTTAVDDVSFTVKPYEVLGYLGPNGSGKSTTVNMITGLLEPPRGEVMFDGRSIQSQLIEYKRRLGFVPEQAHLYPHLTGREYLQLVGRLRGLNKKSLDRKIDRSAPVVRDRCGAAFADRVVLERDAAEGADIGVAAA
jgi:ABC-2 type transport system ATP-binding protein